MKPSPELLFFCCPQLASGACRSDTDATPFKLPLRSGDRHSILFAGSKTALTGDHLMELMQLRMLLAAAERKSLQKAGQAVGRTPQAVGMAIDKLENELGVSLFHVPN